MNSSTHFTHIRRTLACLALIGAAFNACTIGPSRHPTNNPCGPHGEPWKNKQRVIAQTVDPDGTVVDWVPAPPSAPAPQPLPLASDDASPSKTNIQVSTPLAGPPGTVPVPHPKGLVCECDSGYVSHPGQPCVAREDSCEPEGSTASGKEFTQCCEGLTSISPEEPVNGKCQPFGMDFGVCSQCGNGICGPGENYCNCPRDCRK